MFLHEKCLSLATNENTFKWKLWNGNNNAHENPSQKRFNRFFDTQQQIIQMPFLFIGFGMDTKYGFGIRDSRAS